MADEEFEEFIGPLIRHARVRLNLSQCELGELMGVSNITVSSWEQGITAPYPKRLPTLASVLYLHIGLLEMAHRNTTAGRLSPQDAILKAQAKGSKIPRSPYQLEASTTTIQRLNAMPKTEAQKEAARQNGKRLGALPRTDEQRENGRRQILKAQKKGTKMASERQRAKTHCKCDHPLFGENLYIDAKTGRRHCRTCSRAAHKRWKERQSSRSASS
jgi:transcriptional regulator with XRE-family HTH domain